MKPAIISFATCLATLIWVVVSVGQQTNTVYGGRVSKDIPHFRPLTTNDLPVKGIARPVPGLDRFKTNEHGIWVRVIYDRTEYMELAEEEADTEIIDLGVITNYRAILLTADTNRADFLMFRVGLTAIGDAGMDTNFTTTNRILQAKDMRGIPFGPVLLGVRTVCGDGAESPVAIYRFELRMEGPRRPTATTTIVSGGIIATNESLKIMRERRRKARAKDAGAPMPGVTGSAISEPPPMAGGTNQSYDVEVMRKYFNQKNRK